jgi:hypothetical protein
LARAPGLTCFAFGAPQPRRSVGCSTTRATLVGVDDPARERGPEPADANEHDDRARLADACPLREYLGAGAGLRNPLARLATPVTRSIQQRVTKRYLSAIAQASSS